MFQGQFGGKIGKRFDRWGVFGKARPGFVGFSRVLQNRFGIQVGQPLTFERTLPISRCWWSVRVLYFSSVDGAL